MAVLSLMPARLSICKAINIFIGEESKLPANANSVFEHLLCESDKDKSFF